MNRVLCLWFPNWPLLRLLAARAELSERAVVLYEAPPQGGLRVATCSKLAHDRGIFPGMPLAEAIALGQAAETQVGAKRSREKRFKAKELKQKEFGTKEAKSEKFEAKAQPSNAGPLSLWERDRVRVPSSKQLSPLHSTLTPALSQREREQKSTFTPALSQRAREQEGAAHAGLLLEAYDPRADRLALEQWAEWCQRFSPTVGLEEAEQPECLLFDVTGLGHLFGSEAGLAAAVQQALAGEGLRPRVAVADTIGAAWALALYGEAREDGSPLVVPPDAAAAALAPLPVAALRLPAETLAWLAELGIERVEQLMALPRGTLLARFGEHLLKRLDQATGAATEVIVSRKLPAEFKAEWLLEFPTTRSETIDLICERLTTRLATDLGQLRKGVLQLDCRLKVEGSLPIRFGVGLYEPSASGRHLLELVRLRLETLRLAAPVTAIELSALAIGDLAFEQQQLFAEEQSREAPRQLAVLVDRLTSRLGREAVLRPALVDDAQPEHACQYLPMASERPRRQPRRPAKNTSTKNKLLKTRSLKKAPPGKDKFFRSRALGPGQRPTIFRSKAVPIAVTAQLAGGPPGQFRCEGHDHRVTAAWGPERIETGWWRGLCVRRDYYRVETNGGNRYWLFKDLRHSQWFLQGEFA